VDPDLKTWKRELVCDKCRRWASALTLIKAGDGWNGFVTPPELVGKRLCYTCIARIFRFRPPGPDSPAEVPEAILIVSTAVIFLIALLVRIDPTIPGLLFVGSLGFVALERDLKDRLHGRPSPWRRNPVESQRTWEAWKARKPSEPLVSVDTLFEEHSM
jgi:hypothetical protein